MNGYTRGNLFNTICFPQPTLAYYISTDNNCSGVGGEWEHVSPRRTARVHYKSTGTSPPVGDVVRGTSGSPYPRVVADGDGETCTLRHYTAVGEDTDTLPRRVSAAGGDNDDLRSPVAASADEASISRRRAAAVGAAGGATDNHKVLAGGTDPVPSLVRAAAGGEAVRGR